MSAPNAPSPSARDRAAPHATPRPPGSGALARAAPFVAALVCAAIFTWLQSTHDEMIDGDSYFHTRAAHEWLEHGTSKTFPQANFSTWRDHYADKDFLYHVLLAPFVLDEASLVEGGRLAAIAFVAAFLLVFALAVDRLGIRFGALWILLPLAAHRWWILHMLTARPHVLAVTLLLLEIVCLLRGRYRWLALLCALHVWAHSSYVLLPGLPVALLLARWLSGEALRWQPFAATALGLAAGLGLHPYFPNNLSLSYDQLVEVARSVWGLRPEVPPELFGGELLALEPRLLIAMLPAWLPAVAGWVVWSLRNPRPQLGSSTLALGLIALGLLPLTLLTTRFLAFFLPVGALFAGALWTRLAVGKSLREAWASGPRALAAVGVALWLLGTLGYSIREARDYVQRTRSPSSYRTAIEWLDARAKPEDQIYHNFWWAFSWLYHYRPDGLYVQGLDPIFFYRSDPLLFEKALRLHRGERAGAWRMLARDFGARWAFFERLPRTLPAREALDGNPNVRRVYRDAYAEIFLIRQPQERIPRVPPVSDQETTD